MSDTSIQWVHLPGHVPVSWNPIRGCSRVSPGCGGGTPGGGGGCYAESIAGRFCGPGQPFEGFATRTKAGARWTGKVELLPAKLAEPLSWRKPRCCFVNSMSDLFHESLSFEEIAAVIGVIAACPESKFLTLTKRSARMLEWFEWIGESAWPAGHLAERARSLSQEVRNRVRFIDERVPGCRAGEVGWPLPNLWLGVSTEDQQRWDERVPDLLRCPAAVRFVSAEPLISSIRLWGWCEGCGAAVDPGDFVSGGHAIAVPPDGDAELCGPVKFPDQVIVGSESGPGARPMDIEWVRSIRDQCKAAGVAFFMKQLSTSSGKKITDPEKWPEDLRIREWPDGH